MTGSLGGAGERLPQPLPAAPSESSTAGQADANSPRHPAVGAAVPPSSGLLRACPKSVSGVVSSVGAEGQTGGAAHYNSLYLEAHGSWKDAWRELYG